LRENERIDRELKVKCRCCQEISVIKPEDVYEDGSFLCPKCDRVCYLEVVGMREECPKTGKVIDKPSECEGCEFFVVTIPAGWICTYSNKAEKRTQKRMIEGYLYCIPYMGDRWILTPKNHGTPPHSPEEFWKWRENMNIMEEKVVDELFDGLEGKKVRITVEVMDNEAVSE